MLRFDSIDARVNCAVRRLAVRQGAVSVALLAALLSVAACGERGPSAPKGARQRASFAIIPTFASLPVGAPTVDLGRIRGVVRGAAGDSLAAEALFQGDSAVLVFQVQFSGAVGVFDLDLTAYDRSGVVAYRGHDVVRVHEGDNPPVAPATLQYAAPDAALASLHVLPPTVVLQVGAGAALTVTGATAGGQPVSPIHVGWTSRDPNVVSVDANGAIQAGSFEGAAWVVARTPANLSDSALVRVHAPLASIAIAPSPALVVHGDSLQLTAVMQDGSGHPITDRTIVWTSSDPSRVPVNAAGWLTGVVFGATATITASVDGKAAQASAQVVSAVDHIEWAPASLTFASLGEVQSPVMKVVARPGKSVAGLSVSATPQDPTVVSIDASGAVTALKNGATTIVATVDGVQGSLPVTVQQVARTIRVSPKSANAASKGAKVQFTAAVSDALGKAIVGTVAWQSSNAAVATVDNTGMATSVGDGTASITASVGPLSDAGQLVVQRVPVRIALQLPKASIKVGESMVVTAAAVDAGGVPVSAGAVFSTTTPNVLTVTPGGGVTGLAPGIGALRVQVGPMSTSAVVTVTAVVGAFTLNVSTVEKLPNGTEQFSVVPEMDAVFLWSVNGIDGGNATYGTITSNGFYTAPATVPELRTFNACARTQALPVLQACAAVTINPIPSAGGEIIVVTDMNNLQDGFINGLLFNDARYSNLRFWQNVVNFDPVGPRASASAIMFHRGHNSQCGPNQCDPASLTTLYTLYTNAEYTIIDVNDPAASIGAIPPNVKVLFLMTPQVAYSTAEVNNLKQFAAEGGRLVFIGENGGYYTIGIPIENDLLAKLGAVASNQAALASCNVPFPGYPVWVVPAAQLQLHQLTSGVSGLYIPCASPLLLGPNDYAIAYGVTETGGQVVPIIAIAKIDLTPTPITPNRLPSTLAPLLSKQPSRQPNGGDTTGLGPGRQRPRSPQ